MPRSTVGSGPPHTVQKVRRYPGRVFRTGASKVWTSDCPLTHSSSAASNINSALNAEPLAGGGRAWANWVAGIAAVYSALFGIGKLIFGPPEVGIVLLVIAIVAFTWIARSLQVTTAQPLADSSPASEAHPVPQATGD